MTTLKYKTDTKKFSELKNIVEIPRFQRGLVWGKEKKREFIKTLKAGLPIGVLLLSKKDDHYLVIDGLQRFTTMKDYSKDYFSYIEKEELSDTEIMTVILASSSASSYYNLFDNANKSRIRECVRQKIVTSISKGQGQNLLTISRNAAQAICDDIAEFPPTDEVSLLDPIYCIVDSFSKRANIDDIEIPLIVFLGNEDELATIYQKLNQEGVKLSKYDVFAATWINHTVTVKNDTDFIELIIKKYDAAQRDSNLEIANYDPDLLRQQGELTVFEYAFAIGKAIMNACPKLFPNKKDDSKIDSIGFLILAELMGLSYSKMGNLAVTMDTYHNLNYKVLKDYIVDCARIVENALGSYIISPTTKKPSLVCHSELQLISYIIILFKVKYNLTQASGIEIRPGATREVREIKNYLPKHYLYDILRGFWSGSGDSKLEEIIASPSTCRYMKDVDRTSFEMVVNDWLASANKKKTQATVTTEAKLFLNYLLRGRVHDADRREYDIEHCVPKKILKDYYIERGIDVPISSVCNLVFIPTKENRSKGDLTYYQKQDRDATTYSLNSTELEKLVYPPRSDLQFVESSETLTLENYQKFLHDREAIVSNALLGGLYH